MKKTVSVAPMMDCTDKHEIYFLSLISKNIHSRATSLKKYQFEGLVAKKYTK